MVDALSNDPFATLRADPVQEPPINDGDIFNIFLHILRDTSIYREAKRLLRPDFFEMTTERHYRMFWATVLEFCDQYGPPHYAGLFNALQHKQRLDPLEISSPAWDMLLKGDYSGLLYYCMYYPPEHLLPAYGRHLLQQFLQERAVLGPLRGVLSKGDRRAFLHGFGDVVSAVASQMRQIDSISRPPAGEMMPEIGSALPAADIFVPTGIPHFDQYIIGQRPGDCNGLLGVFGGGKTTQCIALSVMNARNFYRIGNTTQTAPKLSVFLSYEEPEYKLKKRIWANASSIRHSKLAGLSDWGQLTTQENLEEYERHLAGRTAGEGCVLSETERWAEARIWLNRSFRLLDMSGSEANPGAGMGYVDEVVGALDRLRNDSGSEIGAVHIDYAKNMCERYMNANSISSDKLRNFISHIGDELRREVAERFGCTVWLMHQLAADQNKQSPTKLLHHSDAMESKAFAEHLAVCGCLGVKDEHTGCILLNWSKVRYNENHCHAAPVLQIDGDFCRLIDVSHRYNVDTASRSFIDPETLHQIEGPRVAASPIGSGPRGLDYVRPPGDFW